MNKAIGITITLVLIAAIAYFGFYFYSMRNVKIPKYQVVEKQGPIEIRVYQPIITAQVALSGNSDVTINKGFKILADYIFGNNIAMTAPVTQQQSTKIAMTAPVMQQGAKQQWTISFVMPSKYSLETLPKPNNQQITIKEIPQHKVVVIRYSGNWSQQKINENKQRLEAFIKDKKLEIMPEPIYAYYNPPWTLPFMRRNEIMYRLID